MVYKNNRSKTKSSRIGGFNAVGPGCSLCQKMGIDQNKIRRALISQLERYNLKITNHQDLSKQFGSFLKTQKNA